MADVTELTDSNFQAEVIDSPGPVLVDFWRPGVALAEMIAPLIEELAQANADGCKFAKINIDETQSIAAAYGVTSIPTLMIFKGGEVVDRFVGVQPKARLQEAIDQAQQ